MDEAAPAAASHAELVLTSDSHVWQKWRLHRECCADANWEVRWCARGLHAPGFGNDAVRAALKRAFGLPSPRERTSGVFDYAPGEIPSGNKEKLPWRVDEVIFGNARPAGVGPNAARQIAWRAGLGDGVPAFTVNMACASGLRAVMLGWQEILTGQAEIIAAGGAESMSQVPYLIEGRWGFSCGVPLQIGDRVRRDQRQKKQHDAPGRGRACAG